MKWYPVQSLTDNIYAQASINLGKVQKKLRVVFEEFAHSEFLPWMKKNRSNKYYLRNQVALNRLVPFFKNKILSEITPFLIEKYKMERLSQVKPATVRNDLACLKRLFSLACKWSKAIYNPVKEIEFPKTDNKIERILTEEEETSLLNACGIIYSPKRNSFVPDPRCEHLKPMVITALDTGMRLGEILNLKWSQIDFAQKIIQVESYKVYPVPISERLYSVLHEIKKDSSREYVFYDKLTNQPFGSIKTAFNTACRRARITGLRFHDLRHTFASRLRAKGVDLVTIKELLGHADIKTTMRYAHTNMEAKKAAIAALNGHKSVTVSNLVEFQPQRYETVNKVLTGT